MDTMLRLLLLAVLEEAPRLESAPRLAWDLLLYLRMALYHLCICRCPKALTARNQAAGYLSIIVLSLASSWSHVHTQGPSTCHSGTSVFSVAAVTNSLINVLGNRT